MILGWPPTAADKHAEQKRQTAKDFHWWRRRHVWNSIHRVLNEGNVMWPTAGWGAATLFVCKQRERERMGKRRTHITNWLIMRLLVKPNKLKCQIKSSLPHTLEIFHFNNWLLCKSKVYSWEKSIQIWTCRLKCLKCVEVVKSKVETLPARAQLSVGGHKKLWWSRRNAIPARRRSAASQKKR